MAAITETLQPDDLIHHLETILAADTPLESVPEGATETDEQRELRESIKLRPALRARAERVVEDLGAQVSGITAAEAAKLMATKEGQAALAKGMDALARVDSHLNSVTSTRNPLIGKLYGVYGANPTTFSGVMRALELSVNENAAIAGLPDDHADRHRLFTPVVKRKVETARDELARLVSARIGTRAELSQTIEIKNETRAEAESVLADVREHLYANLPNGKKDTRLRQYGYRPIRSGRSAPGEDDTDTDADLDVE